MLKKAPDALQWLRLQERHEAFSTRRGGRVVPADAPILRLGIIAGHGSTCGERVIVGPSLPPL
jgi:hypothetical protein